MKSNNLLGKKQFLTFLLQKLAKTIFKSRLVKRREQQKNIGFCLAAKYSQNDKNCSTLLFIRIWLRSKAQKHKNHERNFHAFSLTVVSHEPKNSTELDTND